jgi:hypothetical protein
VEESVHDHECLRAFHADAEGWAEYERERDLMAALIEAAHLKSAARDWYRLQGLVAAREPLPSFGDREPLR